MSTEQSTNNINKYRIVILCGPNLTHENTCATLISAGLNVVGICEADQRTFRVPLSYLKRSAKKKGFWVTISRIAARVLYLVINSRKDRAIFRRLFDEKAIHEILGSWGGEIRRTWNYSDAETIEWLRAMKPDIFVVHTGYWVGKEVREIPATKIVVGGHPGLTPYYRGSSSAFWAIYLGKPEDIGCTVFLLDDGVDTGEIVVQERIPVESGDSFITLGWKGMIRTVELQAQVLKNYNQGIEIPRAKVPVPENSEFDNPTLGQYLRYSSKQREIR